MFEGKLIRTIQVPFTDSEISALRMAREIQDSWWEVGKHGSGYHRDLGTGGLGIPWGTMLLKREVAEQDAKKCFDKIQRLLEKPDKNKDLVSLEEDLKKIAGCLTEVFPKISEDQKPT